jgi:hypothetical protein
MPPPSLKGSKLSLASLLRCNIVDWHSLSWKKRAGKLSPAFVLMTTLPNHQPKFGGLTRRLYTSLTGTENAYAPWLRVLGWLVVSGGAGTRKDCFGGVEVSVRSTLTYVS